MPRQARTISATNVYHAILRGVNKQQVFEDDEDYIRFLNVLRRQTQPDVDAQGQTFQPRCHVYAYCLMGNHVHLLLKEGSETIGNIMKWIASSYVYHYNHKYGRVGHLFQERFKSQPVNDFSYFTTLIINSYYLIDNKRCKGIKLNANCYFYWQCNVILVARK